MQPQIRSSAYTLRDSPFFRLRSRKKLADLLHVSVEALQRVATADDLYVRRWKHKTKKNEWLVEEPSVEVAHFYRPIDIPDPGLKLIQSRIAKILSRVTPPDWLFSPVKGRSYVDNAARHKQSTAFWLLDIAEYFPSCSANKVAHLLRRKMECSPDVVAIFTKLTTLNECLPQGSPCSPVLAYLAHLDMWASIADIVHGAGLTHSVYADDITISGELVRKEVIWGVKRAVHKHGLRIKHEKELSIIRKPVEVTGVIVNGGQTLLPNRQLKRLFELRGERQRAKSSFAKASLDLKINGRVAQMRQVEQRGLPS